MNNYNNNFYGNQFGMYPNGFGYNKPKLAEPTNPLTKEEMAVLKQKAPQFSLAVSQVDSLRAICTHRDNNGETLIQNSDGSVTCTICGKTFTPVNANQESVNDVFKCAIDALETIKIMYMDIPDDVTRNYFQMIPYLEKAPQLFKIANDHYSRYSSSTVMNRDFNMGGNAFALYNTLLNPAMGMGMGNPGMAYNNGMMPNPGMPMQPQVPDVTMGAANNGVNPFDSSSSAPMNNVSTVTDNKQYSL